MSETSIEFHLRYTGLQTRSLPWEHSLLEWEDLCDCLEDAPRGVHRHPVVFIIHENLLYAIKELPGVLAQREYELLCEVETLHLPVVTPVGWVQVRAAHGATSLLVTRYLEGALPYRLLLAQPSLEPYRGHLLDALAGLMVELHLSGIFWGDCSLSNTLFRRDAGALRAYVVDLETAEYTSGQTKPTLRFHDLQIMEENVDAELADLELGGVRIDFVPGIPASNIGAYIRLRYQELWDEVTREDTILPGENYRIQERVRALNRLGFSIGDIRLAASGESKHLSLRVIVSDRNFHRDQLYNLTGVDAEEMQAQKMMNEIQEVRARMSNEQNRNVSLSAAAHHWLENTYEPVMERLAPYADRQMTRAELYCQVLEHKWYLSERAQMDVGHFSAVDDYLKGAWFQQKMDF